MLTIAQLKERVEETRAYKDWLKPKISDNIRYLRLFLYACREWREAERELDQRIRRS